MFLIVYPRFENSTTRVTILLICHNFIKSILFTYLSKNTYVPGVSSLGVPGVPWHTQILADQLTLFQPWGTDYDHLITNSTPRCSELPTALLYTMNWLCKYLLIFVFLLLNIKQCRLEIIRIWQLLKTSTFVELFANCC